ESRAIAGATRTSPAIWTEVLCRSPPARSAAGCGSRRRRRVRSKRTLDRLDRPVEDLLRILVLDDEAIADLLLDVRGHERRRVLARPEVAGADDTVLRGCAAERDELVERLDPRVVQVMRRVRVPEHRHPPDDGAGEVLLEVLRLQQE